MFKRKRLVMVAVAIVLFLFTPTMMTTAFAGDENPAYQLCVWMKSGEKTAYRFDEQPRFSLEGNTINFETNNVCFCIDPLELDRFTIEKVEEAVNLAFFVWLRDGSRFGYPFEEKPEVYLGAEVFTLKTTKTQIEFPANDIEKFTLEDDSSLQPTTISSVELLQSELHFRQGDATITGMKPDGEVRVFNMAGHLVQIVKADGEGFAVVPMGGLPQGIYIIKTETTTYKIQKK